MVLKKNQVSLVHNDVSKSFEILCDEKKCVQQLKFDLIYEKLDYQNPY